MRSRLVCFLLSILIGTAVGQAGESASSPRAFLGVIVDSLQEPTHTTAYYREPGNLDTGARLEVEAARRLRQNLGATGGGLLLDWIVVGSPASKTLRNQDVLLALDGETLGDPAQLGAAIHALQPGDAVTLKVWREGRIIELPVALAERPAAGDPDVFFHQDRVPAPLNRVRPEYEVASLGDPPLPEFPGSTTPNWLDQRPTRDADSSFPKPQRISRAESFHRNYRDAPWSEPDNARQSRSYWIAVSEGRRIFTAKAHDQVFFSGPIDTEADRKAVPRKFRNALASTERLGVRVITPASLAQHFDAGGAGRVTGRDDEGNRLELRIADGRKEVSIIGAFERELFRGPANTPEERAAIPAKAWARLEEALNRALPSPANGLTTYAKSAF